MQSVKYQDMDGEWHEVEPFFAYSVVNRTEKMVCAEFDKRQASSFGECIALALRVLASEPFYLRKDSIPWLMTYVSHIGNSISNGRIRVGAMIDCTLMDMLYTREKGHDQFIFLTRIVGAISFVMEACFVGVHWKERGSKPVHYSVDPLFGESAFNLPDVRRLQMLYDKLHTKGEKAWMSKLFADQTPLVFQIPPGERMVVSLPEGDRTFSEGVQFSGAVQRFHLSSAPARRGISRGRCYTPMCEGLESTPFHVRHAVMIDYENLHLAPHPYLTTRAQLSIPHEWIIGAGEINKDMSAINAQVAEIMGRRVVLLPRTRKGQS